MLLASRFRRFLLLAALLLPALLPAPVLAGGPTTGGGVLLRYAFRAGEMRRMAGSIQIEMQVPTAPDPLRVDMEVQAATRTERIWPDGSATIASVIERMDMFVMGDRAPLPDMAGLTTRQRMYPDGRVTETEIDSSSLERLGLPPNLAQQLPLGGGQAAFTQNFAGTSTELPDRPLRVGEFIDREQTVDLAALALAGGPFGGPGGRVPLTARSRLTLEELTTLGGRRVARLTETISASLTASGELGPGMNMTGRVSNVLDAATAWPVAGDATMDVTYSVPVPNRDGQVETLTIPVTMRLSYRVT